MPDKQTKGMGSMLMGAVERAAAEAGLVSLTVPSSLTAEGFYARLGYVLVDYEFFGEEKTAIMQRELA
jgi:histone acetyltransferase (RNA polymerase elongator complex component)